VAALLRAFFSFLTSTRYRRPRQLEPGRAKERFVLIQPPAPRLFSGALAPEAIKPAPVGAVRFPAPAKNNAGKIVIHFAGGAFVLVGTLRTSGSMLQKFRASS
jgi:hypothetical protein